MESKDVERLWLHSGYREHEAGDLAERLGLDLVVVSRGAADARDYHIDVLANRVMTAVLLDKPGKRAAEIEADFLGFECPDQFVVGYGMDMRHAYRELPFVGYVTD